MKKTYFRQCVVLSALGRRVTHEYFSIYYHRFIELLKGYRIVCNSAWAAVSSMRYERCDVMDVLIFVALPNYFIEERTEREVDCDTSVHHSIEEKNSFNLRCSFNIKR